MNRRHIVTALGLPAAIAAAGAGWFAWAKERNPYYQGPVSDHFDGLRFFNPGRPWSKTWPEVYRALLAAEREEWPQAFPSPFRDTPPRRVAGTALRVAAIGHASFLIQAAGLNVLIDPVFAERASPLPFAGPKRVNPPGIAFEDLPPIDAVLVSHNHYDHLDLAALARLAMSHRPRVLTPLGNDAIMLGHNPNIRAEAYDWGDSIALSADVTVTLTPALHWSARGFADRRKALWAAFVIETPAGTLYHVADSAYGDGAHFRAARERHGPFRLAVLPIGAYEPRWFMKDQHMNPAEAVRAWRDSGAEHAIGHHWGTFRLTAEGIERPLDALQAALADVAGGTARFRAVRPGEVWQAA
jgi:L-ascorbate metabolism protein UlaG (beta-lactamase superfamily)